MDAEAAASGRLLEREERRRRPLIFFFIFFRPLGRSPSACSGTPRQKKKSALGAFSLLSRFNRRYVDDDSSNFSYIISENGTLRNIYRCL